MKVLELDHVSMEFPDGDGVVMALDDVSFTVDGGEFVAVTGPSGSGKSTLLAVAGLLLTPTSGRVLLDGREVTGKRRSTRTDLRRNRIGFVFQQPHLLGSLTAREQLEMVARLSGDRSAAAKKRALSLLDEVGLSAVADRRPAALSGGQRQRVGIARALMNQPQLLLVDEPTSALDHDRGLAIIDLLRGLTVERGVGTVVVTHDLATLGEHDEVVRIVDGRISEPVAR
ncbi:ABC transporter ATP-binding protein [Calidifontibacter indicus]|uniref:Putative ABC transport system ATP-binding protein n=1 Tax=Calidifontibacter indicus TaxID=419650 RepID=A0A3D9UIS8_9MICO|nr:ABC transporter ATP-binding protein [Calidifontibacter indicus]REF29207.1 putative ABC transport system ATP-binding protein [Calidifontibacter indicus]